METRKVQITGGSTFMVTLPKKWAEEVGLKSGSKMHLIPHFGNLLVLKPAKKEEVNRGVLQIEGKSGDVLIRAVISMYISGYDIIEVRGEKITPTQRATVRKTSQNLIGPEIMEESGTSITIHNLLDSSELSVPQTVKRIYLITKSMLKDALTALKTNDGELAQDVKDRDTDVDRLFLMISRQFRFALRDVLYEEEVGIGRLEFLSYHTAAYQLERIADHAVKIADVAGSLEDRFDEAIISSILPVEDLVIKTIEKAVTALENKDTDQANLALDLSKKVDDRLTNLNKRLYELDSKVSQLLGIVSDSIGRAKDYGTNIAETALDAASPSPA